MENSVLKASNKRKFKFKLDVIAIFSFMFCALVLVLPFILSKVHSGQDIEYHFSIIRSMNDAFKNGNFLSKINNLTGQDYGYANGIFYSVVPAGIAVILMNVFSLGITGAVALEMFLLFSLNGIVFYYFCVRMFNNKKVAIVAALLYQINPYVINQFYIRFSFAEIFLSLAVPLVFWGLGELFYKNNTAAFLPLFTIGYSLSLLCHLTVTVYYTVFVLIFLCFNLKQIFKGKKIFPLMLAACLVLAITAFFSLPLALNLGISNSSSLSYTSAFLSFNGLWSFVLPWLLCSSVVSLIAIVKLAKHLKQNRGQNSKNVICLFVLLNCSFIASTCIFPWFLLPNFVGMIQYVWRLFSINTLFVYLTFAYLFLTYGFKFNLKGLVAVVLVSLGCFTANAIKANSTEFLTSAAVKSEMYEQTISAQSDNYGLGSIKKLNYTPKKVTQQYMFTRANDALVKDANVTVKELANYFSLNQISFVVDVSHSSYVVLNLPYEYVNNITAYKMETAINLASHDIEMKEYTTPTGSLIKLVLADVKGESKITLAYDETFKQYLIKNPFEFIVKSGQATATNFIKKNASTYTVDFVTSGARVELPTFYYKGYTITYTNASGKSYSLNPIYGENGFIEVDLKESGTLSIAFDAGYIKMSNILSLTGVVALAVSCATFGIVTIVKRRRTRRGK